MRVWLFLALVAAAGAAELRLVPTFENCGVYVEKTAAGVVPAALHLVYRPQGAAAWLPAHPLSASANDPTPRGSLFGLRPDSEYQVQCRDGADQLLAEGSFRTWTEAVPIAKTIRLKESHAKGGPLLIDQGGTAAGWVRYVGEPGYVLDGKDLDSEAILLENASYVILENLAVRGGQRHGIRLLNSQHVRIRNCDIAGFGRLGEPGRDGKFYVPGDAKAINWDAGVYIDLSGNLVIENCFIHDPRGRANSWFSSHPAGPNGIFVRSTGSTVIRYNDLVGSHAHRWNDAIEGYGNGKVDGGFNQDADIYGNFLAFANDDGIELDGGQCNVRFYGNKIEGGLCGISTAPNTRGPSYLFRNLVTNLGDDRGYASAAIKNGGGSSHTQGLTFLYHNTFFGPGNGHTGIGFGSDKDRGLFLSVSCNNLFAMSGAGILDPHTPPACDYDYDLFATPTGEPGYHRLGRALEAHGRLAPAGFRNAAAGDFRLLAGSAAGGGGTPLPGFPASLTADCGALPLAEPEAGLPLRPTGLLPDAWQLDFAAPVGAAPSERRLTIRTPGLQAPARFVARWNDDATWLAVSPVAGTLEPGRDTVLTVRMQPAATPGLRLAALLVRLESGLSLPVSLYACTEPARYRQTISAANAEGAHAFAREEGGAALLFEKRPAAEGQAEAALRFPVEVPAAGPYYLYFRVRCPEPVPMHDSFFVGVNGEAPQVCPIAGSALWSWTSCTGAAPTLSLRQGVNELRLAPRESLVFDAIELRSTPRPPAGEPRQDGASARDPGTLP